MPLVNTTEVNEDTRGKYALLWLATLQSFSITATMIDWKYFNNSIYIEFISNCLCSPRLRPSSPASIPPNWNPRRESFFFPFPFSPPPPIHNHNQTNLALTNSSSPNAQSKPSVKVAMRPSKLSSSATTVSSSSSVPAPSTTQTLPLNTPVA